MVLLFSFFFCSGGFLVAHADNVPYDGGYETTGVPVSQSAPISPNSTFDFVQHYALYSNGAALSSTVDACNYNDMGYSTYKRYINLTGNSTWFLRNYATYVGPSVSASPSPTGVSAFGPSWAGGFQYTFPSTWLSSFSIRFGNVSASLVPGQKYGYCMKTSSNISGTVPPYVSSLSGAILLSSTQVSSTVSDMEYYLSYGYFEVSEPCNIRDVVFNCSSWVHSDVRVLSLSVFPSGSDDDSIISAIDRQTGVIQNQTDKIDSSLNQQGQQIQDKIESQYDTSQGSEVGSAAQGFADQAAESLGVVSYVDTLFSGLSGLVTAGSTTLTFPAFAIAVQGTDYQVWQEHTFDLSQLDGWFSGLMAAVRLATSVVVVGAVIHYLQSVYKDVIG